MLAKSLVNPAKMLILRSLPRTSDKMIESPSPGAEVDGESEGGGGMAGPRFCSVMGLCFWGSTATASDAVNSGYISDEYLILASLLLGGESVV